MFRSTLDAGRARRAFEACAHGFVTGRFRFQKSEMGIIEHTAAGRFHN